MYCYSQASITVVKGIHMADESFNAYRVMSVSKEPGLLHLITN